MQCTEDNNGCASQVDLGDIIEFLKDNYSVVEPGVQMVNAHMESSRMEDIYSSTTGDK